MFLKVVFKGDEKSRKAENNFVMNKLAIVTVSIKTAFFKEQQQAQFRFIAFSFIPSLKATKAPSVVFLSATHCNVIDLMSFRCVYVFCLCFSDQDNYF